MTALSDKLTNLKLDFMAQELELALTDAAARNLSPADTLEWLADLELDGRQEKIAEGRTSEVYAVSSTEVLKLYKHGFETVCHVEFEKTRRLSKKVKSFSAR